MIKVCVVEDNPDIREGLIEILNESKDFECIGAFSNAEDAIIEVVDLEVDVIVMDIHLPGMNGIDCVRIITTNQPQIKCLMFTIDEEDQQVFDALKAGAIGYILKTTPPAKILEAVQEIYDGGSPMNAIIARKLVGIFHEKKQQKEVLSTRENEVLLLISKGLFYKEIADRLFISVGTVKQHLHHIYEKLHVQNKTEAINKVFRANI